MLRFVASALVALDTDSGITGGVSAEGHRPLFARMRAGSFWRSVNWRHSHGRVGWCQL